MRKSVEQISKLRKKLMVSDTNEDNECNVRAFFNEQVSDKKSREFLENIKVCIGFFQKD